MIWVVATLGLLGYYVLWAYGQVQKKTADAAMAERNDAQRQLTATAAALKIEQEGRADDRKRLEMVNAKVKADVLGLENELARLSTPDAIRARLSKLFNP